MTGELRQGLSNLPLVLRKDEAGRGRGGVGCNWRRNKTISGRYPTPEISILTNMSSSITVYTNTADSWRDQPILWLILIGNSSCHERRLGSKSEGLSWVGKVFVPRLGSQLYREEREGFSPVAERLKSKSLYSPSVLVCLHISVNVCGVCTCASLFGLFCLCFVMGYVLQFGEIGHRTAPYYYTSTDPVTSMMGGADVMGVASVICDGCGRWWVMWWLLVWWVWLWLISEANVNGETDVMAVAGVTGTSWCSWLWLWWCGCGLCDHCGWWNGLTDVLGLIWWLV